MENIEKSKRQRLEELKNLTDKGYSATYISSALQMDYRTVRKYQKKINHQRAKLITNNKQIADKIFGRISSMLNEADLVKNKYYEILKELEDDIKRTEGTKTPLKHYSTRLSTLKNILERLDYECKLLNSFNPSNFKRDDSISKDMFQTILLTFRSIILELIPKDKQTYAFSRMKEIKLDSFIEGEIVE